MRRPVISNTFCSSSPFRTIERCSLSRSNSSSWDCFKSVMLLRMLRTLPRFDPIPSVKFSSFLFSTCTHIAIVGAQAATGYQTNLVDVRRVCALLLAVSRCMHKHPHAYLECPCSCRSVLTCQFVFCALQLQLFCLCLLGQYFYFGDK